MKKAVEIYKNIVVWISLVLAVGMFFYEVLLERFSLITNLVGQTVLFFLNVSLIIYSVIMLVYILAKKIKGEYLFGFAVPVLLIIIPNLITNLVRLFKEGIFSIGYFIGESGWENIFSLVILFLYSLYHKWRE